MSLYHAAKPPDSALTGQTGEQANLIVEKHGRVIYLHNTALGTSWLICQENGSKPSPRNMGCPRSRFVDGRFREEIPRQPKQAANIIERTVSYE